MIGESENSIINNESVQISTESPINNGFIFFTYVKILAFINELVQIYDF